jgi:hypothetical protein
MTKPRQEDKPLLASPSRVVDKGKAGGLCIM